MKNKSLIIYTLIVLSLNCISTRHFSKETGLSLELKVDKINYTKDEDITGKIFIVNNSNNPILINSRILLEKYIL